MDKFLKEHKYINFNSPSIQLKAAELFDGLADDVQKANAAFEFVRDEIPHGIDIHSDTITAKASDVLEHKTGICHAKANLLAALLRSQGIPAGFCFQRTTLSDDDSQGYVVHCYNAIFINGRWIKVDARGNKPGVNAQFSLDEPVLAFPCRQEYDEYFWPGIYAEPHEATMQILETAQNLQEVLDTIPDTITESPDITEEASQITIRLATPADAPDMAEVHMRSWEVAYKDIIPAAFIKEKNATRHELYSRVITDENTNTYVIQHRGKTIGIMRVAPPLDDDAAEDWYELHFIYLHPDYYRQGIGMQAMEFAYGIAKNFNKKIMVVWVLEENINSIKFYKKCGFTADGKTNTRDFGKVMKSARMRRDL